VIKYVCLYCMSSEFCIFQTKQFHEYEVNSTIESGGRFGNIFIRNMIASRIAEMNNLKFVYDQHEKMNNLGISYYTKGTNVYDTTLLVTDKIIDRIVFDESAYLSFLRGNNIFFKKHHYSPFDHIQSYSWCQTSKIAYYIKSKIDSQMNHIISSNPNRNRYNNNSSVFVHVRLGDTVSMGVSVSYDYYDKVLSSISFETGYISSDSIDHEICQKLIQKYNLTIYNSDELGTIQFAATNKYLVLSNGTFSWLLGLFGFFSKIYYPKIKVQWHGDIFVFPEWKEIDHHYPPGTQENYNIMMEKGKESEFPEGRVMEIRRISEGQGSGNPSDF